jgi:hypothetical protein
MKFARNDVQVVRNGSRVGRWALAGALAALGASHPASAAVNPNFYVFLAFGQSNMEGQAPPESQDYVGNTRFKVLAPTTCSGNTDGKAVSKTQNQWTTAVSPIVRCDTHLSLLDGFGKALADSLPSSDTVGVVPVAVGGTAIRGFVQSAAVAYYASQASWMQTYAGYYGNNPYTRLVATAKEAQKVGVIKGILLHQGETDGYMSGWGDTVKTIYNSLLTDLGLQASEVPLLAGEVYNNAGTNAGIDKLPSQISTAYVISSSGLSIGTYANNQGVHFSAASYRTLGQRYAAQMVKLLPKSTSIAPSGARTSWNLRLEAVPGGFVLHSDAAMERVSLVSVRGEVAPVGSGRDVRIETARLRPGVYMVDAISGDHRETRRVVVN